MQSGYKKALSVIKSITDDMKLSIEYADLDGVSMIDGNRILIANPLKADDASVTEISKCMAKWMLGGYEEIASFPDDDSAREEYEAKVSRIGAAMVLAILKAINMANKDIDDLVDHPFGKLRINGLKISPGLGQYLKPEEVVVINEIIRNAVKRKKK